MNRARISAILKQNLRAAKERRDRALAAFDEATRDMRRLRNAEDVDRMQKASREFSRALRALKEVLIQQNDFLLYGIVPRGLQDAPRSWGRQASAVVSSHDIEFDGHPEIRELQRQLATAVQELREIEAREGWGAELRNAEERVTELREKLWAARRRSLG
jgi:hypothetical protein